MTFDDRLIISPTFYDIAKSQSFICIHMSGVLARKRQRDAMLTRYMHVDCTLISYYLANKNEKRRISFESKVLDYNSLLYYFNTCLKLC